MASSTSDNQTSSAIESALSTLQPIRDLSRNWDVDIASCLEEYLQELIGLSGGSFQHSENIGAGAGSSEQQGSSDVPNFAQAAIILQNSSHVYSRKVEYLHGLVYKALYDFFKSTSTTSKEARRKSADAAIDEFYDFDPNEEFLLLDDVVPEDYTNSKINLKEDADVEGLGSSGTPMNQSLTRTRLSLGGLSVTRAERSSFGGIASSAQQKSLLGTLNNGSLRLVDGLCDVGEDGVLMMPGSQSTSNVFRQESDDQVQGGRNLFCDDAIDTNQDDGNELVDDYDDHSNDGQGFVMNDDDQDDIEGPPVPSEEEDGLVVGVAKQGSKDAPKKVTFAETSELPKRKDPWALLDPHSSEGYTSKPLRKGKTYRLPEGITMLPSECVTGASTRRVQTRLTEAKQKESPKSVILQDLDSVLEKKEMAFTVPMSGLIYGDEFLYLARENAKARAAERRAERKKHIEASSNIEQAAYFHDNEDDYDGGFDFGGDEHDDEGDYDETGNAGMASLDEVYQGSRTDEESNLGTTFEELCRAHIQAFAKGAEDFAFNTKLTDRVGKWQAKLAPILEEEERRAAFDIHKYSKDLLESARRGLQRIKRKSDGSEHIASTTVGFEVVTKNCTQNDVCRMFLASLSLANSGNIHIREGAAEYTFDLISSDVERPMEMYRAPSLVEQKRLFPKFLNGATEVEDNDFEGVDKDANKDAKTKQQRKAPTLRDIPRLTKDMVQLEREDPSAATAAAKQLYGLCDVAHKSNREPMVATGKYDVLNPLADCLLQNNDDKLHYVCLTLNNLSIPHENKRVMALERIHKKLFANLCHVISSGKREAYLCLICLTNLSFYEPAQVSIGQYSPRQSTSLRAPKLPPLENPSSMLRILQDVTAHAAKGTKDYRWAFGLLASLARHSENALLIGLTAIPGLALENIKESQVPSEEWNENSLEDFCLYLIMRLSEVSSHGLGSKALEVMQPLMTSDSGVQGLKATIVCSFLDAPWSIYPNYGVVAAGSVAELMGNTFERKGKKNVYEGNAFVLKTAVGAYAGLARAAALVDEKAEDRDFSNTKVVALPTAVAVIFQIIQEIVAHWGEDENENEFDFHYDLAAAEKAVFALKALLPALLVREKLPRPSKHTENVCFELSQLLLGFSKKASTAAAKSSSRDIGAKIYEAMQSGLPVLEASYDLWKAGVVKS